MALMNALVFAGFYPLYRCHPQTLQHIFVDLNISVDYCINPSHCTILETRGMKCRAHSHVAIRNYDHSFILFHYF